MNAIKDVQRVMRSVLSILSAQPSPIHGNLLFRTSLEFLANMMRISLFQLASSSDWRDVIIIKEDSFCGSTVLSSSGYLHSYLMQKEMPLFNSSLLSECGLLVNVGDYTAEGSEDPTELHSKENVPLSRGNDKMISLNAPALTSLLEHSQTRFCNLFVVVPNGRKVHCSYFLGTRPRSRLVAWFCYYPLVLVRLIYFAGIDRDRTQNSTCIGR